MKKLYTLVACFSLLLSLNTQAQNPPLCYAAFQFTFSNTTAQFYSAGAPDSSVSHIWYFGDGGNSSAANPSHTYANCGTYTVYHGVERHDASGALVCHDSSFLTVTIACNTPCNGISASFTAAMVNNQPNVFEFVNHSVVSPNTFVTCLWNFGDGYQATSSTLANQVHTYAVAGVYNVCLIVTSGQTGTTNVCRDTFCLAVQAQTPTPTPCNLVPTFSAQTSPAQPNVYLFSNTSAPASAIMQTTWSFGDSTTGTGNQVSHTYVNGGTYNVCMHVVVSNTCVRDTCYSIVVNAPTPTPCNVHAVFTTTYVNNQMNVVECVNTSTAGTNTAVYCVWSFGDGTPNVSTSGLGNQTHTYAVSGLYTICLKVITAQASGGVSCVDSICHNIQVQVPASTCNLMANFTTAPTSSPNIISFVNASTGFAPGDSIRWTFGDGTASYDLNPTHNFANPGTYTVCLRISRYIAGAPPCVSEICHQVTITGTTPCSILPNFTYQISPNQSNLVVFTNTSVAPAPYTVSWTFGDGTTGTGNTVTHIYNQPGTYSVCMHIATSNTCSSDSCGTVVINSVPSSCNLTANFSVSSISGNTVNFVNTSTGFAAGDSIRWNFGDGSFSFDVNPTHTYAQAGTYNVCIRISRNNAAGTPCVSEICHQVTIPGTTPCNVHASFTSTSSNNVAQFTNTSTSNSTTATGTYSIWNFGDGTPSVNSPGLQNQVHTYLQAGTYTVCLQVISAQPGTNLTCADSICQTITISSVPPVPCNIHPSFTVNTAPNNPNEFHFTNTTQTSSAQMMTTWNFGDSSVATGNTVSHVFNQPGTYNVCMHVAISNTCSADTCITIAVTGTPNPQPCNLAAHFSWQNSPITPNVVYFLNASGGLAPGDSIRWTFGDGSSSGLLNPVHTYNGSGTYNVCLRISRAQDSLTGAPGCVSEICHGVIVPPTLVAYPNPATNVVNVNVTLNNAGPIYAFIFNAQNMLVGQQIVSGLSGSNTITFNTQNLAPGYYTIRLYYDGHFSVARFLKL